MGKLTVRGPDCHLESPRPGQEASGVLTGCVPQACTQDVVGQREGRKNGGTGTDQESGDAFQRTSSSELCPGHRDRTVAKVAQPGGGQVTPHPEPGHSRDEGLSISVTR
jgi:hypothetical protein